MPENFSMTNQSPAKALKRLDIAAASSALQSGQIIAFPTETYFGVGGTALNPHVAAAVFRAKRRENSLALPIIVGSAEILKLLASEVPPLALKLMEKFWPGPLSLLLPASRAVPELLVGPTGCIAVRQSPHPVAQILCRACQGTLIASSANISGSAPVTRVEELDPELLNALAGVVDLPPRPAGGAPSTLLGFAENDGTPYILRHGAVSREELAQAGFAVGEEAALR